MVLDASGRDISQAREQWRVGALYRWLCDPKIQKVAVEKNIFRAEHLRSMGTRLGRCLDQNKGRQPEDYVFMISANELKLAMMLLLQNRITRKLISRLALQDELDIWRQEQDEYERSMTRWMGEVDKWLDSGAPEGQMPTRPEKAPAGRTVREVVKELQEMRLELEAWFAEAAVPEQSRVIRV